MGYLVGITGNSGCGQSTAAEFIARQCSGVCSLDRVGHRLLNRSYVHRDLADAFSNNAFLTMSENEIRSRLGKIVFEDSDKLSALNSVLHPRMIRWVKNASAILSGDEGIWVLEGALIYELGLDRYLDCVIVIADTAERSAERLAVRDDISTNDARRRWIQQFPILKKSSLADYIVYNSKDLDYMRQQILTIFEEIKGVMLT